MIAYTRHRATDSRFRGGIYRLVKEALTLLRKADLHLRCHDTKSHDPLARPSVHVIYL